jgi:hypothetical protein
MVKNKFLLYKDYFKFASVHRLEFEFLNHFCKIKKEGFEKMQNVEFENIHLLLNKIK